MSFITSEKKNGLGIIEFVPRASFLNVEILDEFKKSFRKLAKNDEVNLIVLFAPQAIYGMNIGYIHGAMMARDLEKTKKFLYGVHEFIEEMYECEKPILGAALGTHLLGGGLEIFLPCDHLLVSPNTLLGLPETGIGIMPGFGGTAISRIIGVRKAAEMIASAKMYSAEETLEMKLVDRIITDVNAPKKEIAAFANKILSRTVPPRAPVVLVPEEANFTWAELIQYAKGKSRFAVTNALVAIRDGAARSKKHDAFLLERERFLNVLFAPNALIGVEAFMNKQKPKFTDAIGG
jgi:enoyl-CoA hydratase